MDSKQKLKIELTKNLSDSQKFDLINKLRENFKSVELRSSVSQKKAFMHDDYRISYFSDDKNNLFGFMLWWNFNHLRFIETYRRNLLLIQQEARQNQRRI